MQLKIRNVVLNYNADGNVDNVTVGFDSVENGTNLYGNVSLTEAEYSENSTTLTTLATLVETKVKANVNE